MFYNQRAYVVIGSIMGISAVGYLMYLYLKEKRCSSNNFDEVKASRPARIEVRIPKKYLGSIIGRGGTIVKAIENDTATKISSKRELRTEEFEVIEIRGAPENAQLAESRIHTIIQSQSETETQELFVPSNSCGKLIGKNGRTIQNIAHTSFTRIKIDPEGENEQRKVIIVGTHEQVEIAKSMIYETVTSKSSAKTQSSKQHWKYIYDKLGMHEGFVEVFVMAMENPSRFWVQVVGPKSLELGYLEQKMTRCYDASQDSIHHRLKEVYVGQFVAAPYGRDERWYRAKVMEISEDKSSLTLFYVDYGDITIMEKNSARVLLAEFLQLHFQAIECKLAKVIPNSDVWTDAGKAYFRILCQVAKWKLLEAKIADDFLQESQEGTESVVSIQLYDRENGANIDVAEEMIRKGFARECYVNAQ